MARGRIAYLNGEVLVSSKKMGSSIRPVTFQVNDPKVIDKLSQLKADTTRIPDLLGVQHFRSSNALLLLEEWTTSKAADQESANNPAYLQYLGELQRLAGGSIPQTMGPFDRIPTS